MNWLSSQPLEIIYKILLELDYIDIISYCSVNREAHNIGYDDIFWMIKLNHDFMILDQDRIPSEYVKRYPHTDIGGKDIYKRWNEFDETVHAVETLGKPQNSPLIMISMSRNCDILMYKMKQGYQVCLLTRKVLYIHIINKSSVDTILDPEIKDIFMPEDKTLYALVMSAINMKRLDVITRMCDEGMVSTNNLGSSAVYSALTSYNINILQYLYSKGIVPDTQIINYYMSSRPHYPAGQYTSIDILNWLETKNMCITNHDLDDFIISGRSNQDKLATLQWSYERGIIPTQEGIDHITQYELDDIIQWLKDHKLL